MFTESPTCSVSSVVRSRRLISRSPHRTAHAIAFTLATPGPRARRSRLESRSPYTAHWRPLSPSPHVACRFSRRSRPTIRTRPHLPYHSNTSCPHAHPRTTRRSAVRLPIAVIANAATHALRARISPGHVLVCTCAHHARGIERRSASRGAAASSISGNGRARRGDERGELRGDTRGECTASAASLASTSRSAALAAGALAVGAARRCAGGWSTGWSSSTAMVCRTGRRDDGWRSERRSNGEVRLLRRRSRKRSSWPRGLRSSSQSPTRQRCAVPREHRDTHEHVSRFIAHDA